VAACAALLALPAAAPPGGRAELVFLAIIVAPALLATAWLAPPPGAEFGASAALLVTAAWSLPASPTRSSVVVGIATLALLVSAARRARFARWNFGDWLMLSVALQALCRGDRLLQPGFSPGERLRLLAILLLLPAAAAAAADALTAAARGWGVAAAAAALAAQGGWHAANTLVLVALAGLAYTLRARIAPLGAGLIPAIAGGLLVALVTPVAAFPWLASRPLAVVAHLPFEVAASARAEDLLAGEVLLDTAHASREWALARPVGEVVVISNLANAAALPAGAAVVMVEAQASDGGISRWTLRNGRETGEWAARRPDVAAPAPRAWQSAVEGEFFAQRYRAVWRLGAAREISRLRLVREPGLPRETVVAIFALEVRR
jgi:hypothetical protein